MAFFAPYVISSFCNLPSFNPPKYETIRKINSLLALDVEQTKTCFTHLEMPDYVSLFEDKRRPKIEKNIYSQQLLEIMQK